MMKTKRTDKKNKNTLRLAVAVGLILLIPFVLTLANPHASINGGNGGGWDWTLSDFIFAFVMLFSAGLAYELVAKKMNNKAYRLAVGLAVVMSLALVWINGAVGIIGDDAWPNLLYLGVLVVGMIGAHISRFKPRGMSTTLFTMAIAQMAVPVIALFITPEAMMETPGAILVFGLNAIFALLFVQSGLLFRQAMHKQS